MSRGYVGKLWFIAIRVEHVFHCAMVYAFWHMVAVSASEQNIARYQWPNPQGFSERRQLSQLKIFLRTIA